MMPGTVFVAVIGGRSVVGNVTARERRTRQFEHYLGLMEHRTLRLVKADCFLVFSVPAARAIRTHISYQDTRICQFAFQQTGFNLDMPDTVLTACEARRAVAERPGFAFALDRPHRQPRDLEFDPVQRLYQYSELRVAAEDVAYVFFDLWSTPLDAWIKVEAATFEGPRRWERDFSMG
jgi:hypothetical protein